MSESTNKKTLFWVAVVFVFQFLLGKLPPIGQMTPMGMHVFFILVGTILGWIFIGMGLPSLSGIIALGLSGAFPSMTACISACLGSQMTWLIAGTIFLCHVINRTNLADYIVGFMLNLKLARKSPFILSFFMFLTVYAISAVSNFFVAIILIISLYRTLAEKANIPSGSLINSYWLCGCAFSCVSGGMYVPWQASALMLGGMYTSATGIMFSNLHWLVCGMGGAILFIIFYVLFGRFVLRIDLSAFDPETIQVAQVKASKEQKVALIYLLVLLALMVIPTSFPNSTFFLFKFFNNLGLGGTMFLLLLAMMIIPINDKPLLDLKTVQFDWNTFLMAAFYPTIAGFIANDAAGITATMTSVLSPILDKIPGVLFVIVCIYLAMIASQFLNNMVVAIIFMSAVTAIAESFTGINLAAAIMAIYMGSNAVCALPSANPVNAITFSNTDLIKFKNQTFVGWTSNFAMATFAVVLYFVMTFYFGLFGMV